MKHSNRLKLSIGAVGIATALVLSGCASGGSGSDSTPSSGGKLTPITLQLQWVAQAQFAGYYAALAQGFYKKEGLDVTIKEAGTTTVPIDVLAAGDADYAISWVPKVLGSIEQGTNVTDVAQIFERSGTTRIDADRRGVQVRTRHGRITARRVIVATGYATEHFRPLAGRFRMYDTYVAVTPPLSDAERRAIGLRRVMIWDTSRPYHYARWTADGRLLVGGGDRRVTPGRRRAARFREAVRELREDLTAVLPALADIGIERAWEGLFAMTADSLPYIGAHRRYPGHLFALGYGGNGMTFGFLAARMLREQWQGVVSPDHDLFRFGRLR